MKEAMWGIGLIMLSLITFVVVGTLSNVTTTNQQDYEFMKSTVESAMYDAIDEVKYRKGICLCTKATGTPAVIKSESSYDILEPNEDSECVGNDKYEASECRYMHGETVVNPDIFTESLISRFGTIAKNQEEYDITVQDVIPYPPKASVRVTYYQFVSSTVSDETRKPIVNQMDAILEGGISEAERVVASTPMVKFVILDCNDNLRYVNETMTVTDLADGTVYYAKIGGDAISLPVGSYRMQYKGLSDIVTVDKNDAVRGEIVGKLREKKLKDCPCNAPDKPTDPDTEEVPIPSEGKHIITTHHYKVGTTEKVHADDTQELTEGVEYKTSHYTPDKLNDKNYEWDGNTPSNATGKADDNYEVIYYYKQKSSGGSDCTNCKWFYEKHTATCGVENDSFTVTIPKRTNFGYKSSAESSCETAVKNACNDVQRGAPVLKSGCVGLQHYTVSDSKGIISTRNVDASSAKDAKIHVCGSRWEDCRACCYD